LNRLSSWFRYQWQAVPTPATPEAPLPNGCAKSSHKLGVDGQLLGSIRQWLEACLVQDCWFLAPESVAGRQESLLAQNSDVEVNSLDWRGKLGPIKLSAPDGTNQNCL